MAWLVWKQLPQDPLPVLVRDRVRRCAPQLSDYDPVGVAPDVVFRRRLQLFPSPLLRRRYHASQLLLFCFHRMPLVVTFLQRVILHLTAITVISVISVVHQCGSSPVPAHSSRCSCTPVQSPRCTSRINPACPLSTVSSFRASSILKTS